MLVLALDCSGDACSAALLEGGLLLARRSESLSRGHAERIAPMLSEILAEAGRAAMALDVVAATVGPGAFTGVRIGLAAAQGIARAAGLQAIGVTVTEAIAADIPAAPGRALLVAVDSRRADPFGEWFEEVDGHWRGRGPDVLHGDSSDPDTPPLQSNPLLAGSAAVAMRDRFGAGDVLMEHAVADPVAVARRAILAVERGTARPAVPLYLRAPDVSAPNRDRNRRGVPT